MKHKFLVLGGDLRQISCAKSFLEKGFEVTIYGFFEAYLKELPEECIGKNLLDDLIRSENILLPLPVSSNGEELRTPLWDGTIRLSEICDNIGENTRIFGGMIREPLLLERKYLFDYAKNEEFLIKNAQITAEGAFDIVFSETPFSVFGSKLLITGYGRIGKILAKIAGALGADTYVAARNIKDLSWIELAGCHPVRYEELSAVLPNMQVILNTVPVQIFTKSMIEMLPKECLFVDLASVPGGIDLESAKAMGIKTIWALSLPGKIAPYSSGRIISDTIINLLNKE